MHKLAVALQLGRREMGPDLAQYCLAIAARARAAAGVWRLVSSVAAAGGSTSDEQPRGRRLLCVWQQHALLGSWLLPIRRAVSRAPSSPGSRQLAAGAGG